MQNARTTLDTFTLDSIPNLDVAVKGALELFGEHRPPYPLRIPFTKPLVVGSGNALQAGKILTRDVPGAYYADESSFTERLTQLSDIDGALLVSASGGKHATRIAKKLADTGIKTQLITNTEDAPAAQYLSRDAVTVLPKNREPYTYNISTYLGMILAETGEDPMAIHEHIVNTVPLIPDTLAKYNAITIIIPARFHAIAGMLQTKFDELFGPFVNGRVFTDESIKHAKTVVSSDAECFVGVGVANEWYGRVENRIHVPLNDGADYGALMAIGYTAIGHIQEHHPPYFKNNIVEYTKEISDIFGQEITPIVA